MCVAQARYCWSTRGGGWEGSVKVCVSVRLAEKMGSVFGEIQPKVQEGWEAFKSLPVLTKAVIATGSVLTSSFLCAAALESLLRVRDRKKFPPRGRRMELPRPIIFPPSSLRLGTLGYFPVHSSQLIPRPIALNELQEKSTPQQQERCT